jgi:hypothetical protein
MRKLFFRWPTIDGCIEEWGIYERGRDGKWRLVRKEHLEQRHDIGGSAK